MLLSLTNYWDTRRASQVILTGYADLYRKFGKKARNKFEVLKIGGCHGPSSRLIPSLVTRFRESHSGIESVQKSGSSKEIEAVLRKNEVDIAIISNPSRSGEFTVEPFLVERVVFVVAKNHHRAKVRTISKTDLAKLPLLVFDDKGGHGVTTEFLRHNVPALNRLNIVMRLDSPDALISAAKSGGGVGVVYEDLVAEELRRGKLKALKPVGFDLSGRSYLVYRNEEVMPPIAREFLEFARTERDSDGKINNQLNSRGD